MSDISFKSAFETSLAELFRVKEEIENNIQNKEKFSGEILNRLEIINDKVKGLGNYINQLKLQLPILQRQSTQNDSQIRDKSANIIKSNFRMNSLNRDVIILKEEKLKLISEVTKTKEQLKTLTEKLNDLTATQATALQQQQEVNNLDQQKLNDKIASLEAKISELTSELEGKSSNVTDIQRQIQQLNEEKESLKNQIDILTKQINELINENKQLKDTIVKSTGVINDVTNLLNNLKDKASFIPGDLENKIKQIEYSISEIYKGFSSQEDTISTTLNSEFSEKNISEILPPAPPPGTRQGTRQRTRTVPGNKLGGPLNSKRGYVDTQTSQLAPDTQTSQLAPDTKTSQVALSREGQPEEILNPSEIDVDFDDDNERGPDDGSSSVPQTPRGGKKTKKNRKLKRGKKTKKNIKQKGGYIYKSNSKRRNIRTTTSRKTPTTSSRKTSARGRVVNKRR